MIDTAETAHIESESLLNAMPLDRWHRAYLAACYARMGRMEEARAEIKAFVEARRTELVGRGEPMPEKLIDLASWRAERYRRQADRDHFLDGLRLAGLTE